MTLIQMLVVLQKRLGFDDKELADLVRYLGADYFTHNQADGTAVIVPVAKA